LVNNTDDKSQLVHHMVATYSGENHSKGFWASLSKLGANQKADFVTTVGVSSYQCEEFVNLFSGRGFLKKKRK